MKMYELLQQVRVIDSLMDKQVSSFYRIDAVVTVVDAAFILPRLEKGTAEYPSIDHTTGRYEEKAGAQHIRHSVNGEKNRGVIHEAAQQVAFADVLVINKVDLVSTDHRKKVQKKLRKINSTVILRKKLEQITKDPIFRQ